VANVVIIIRHGNNGWHKTLLVFIGAKKYAGSHK